MLSATINILSIAINYPIYGTQWHPEKNNFEFNTNEDISHTSNAVAVSQYMADFFVNEARKSNHTFPSSKDEEDNMIYKYNPIHTGAKDGRYKNFEQIYLFHNKK